MSNYSKDDVILVRYPFSDLSASKVRPAVIVSHPGISNDHFIVPLTSQLSNLLPGEFLLKFWKQAGLNVPTAVKRGIYTIDQRLIPSASLKAGSENIRKTRSLRFSTTSVFNQTVAWISLTR